jgi:hypothetical protein
VNDRYGVNNVFVEILSVRVLSSLIWSKHIVMKPIIAEIIMTEAKLLSADRGSSDRVVYSPPHCRLGWATGRAMGKGVRSPPPDDPP